MLNTKTKLSSGIVVLKVGLEKRALLIPFLEKKDLGNKSSHMLNQTKFILSYLSTWEKAPKKRGRQSVSHNPSALNCSLFSQIPPLAHMKWKDISKTLWCLIVPNLDSINQMWQLFQPLRALQNMQTNLYKLEEVTHKTS